MFPYREDKLKLTLWNIMGMRDKFGIKSGELGEVSLPGNHISLLTETWTTDISPPPDLPGYVVIHRPGKQGSWGRAMRGLAIYVAESISHLVSICSSHGSSETLWIKIEDKGSWLACCCMALPLRRGETLN